MVKTEFGIKDLENLSDIKAHTIRIWEKRYNLLEPERTDTNIRKYNLENLKKLLNIAYLYKSGRKISELAQLDSSQIEALIKNNIKPDYSLQVFKTCMFDFNGELFESTIQNLEQTRTFREIFSDFFIPFLNEVGILWHTGTIDPSHEHFISELIKKKIIQKSAEAQKTERKKNLPVFVLYLPYSEIHEIGLLYANYELLSQGFNTLYLGANLPLDSLKHILEQKKNIIFVTSFTVNLEKDSLAHYISEFQQKLCSNAQYELWVMGNKALNNISKTPANIRIFKNIPSFTQQLESITKT